MENPAIININDKPITHNDILIHLKVKGEYKQSLQELIEEWSIKAFAEQNNIIIGDDELQSFVNDYRKKNGLISSQETQKYLSNLGINSDQWIDSLEYNFLKQKVIDFVLPEDRIIKYFEENKLQYLEVELYKIQSDNKDTAEEIFLEAKDDKKDFSELASQYSTDLETKHSAGYLGKIKRAVLPPNIESRVFTADPGTILQPFELDNKFLVFKIGDVIQPQLTDSLKETIKTGLYKLWVGTVIQSMRISLPS